MPKSFFLFLFSFFSLSFLFLSLSFSFLNSFFLKGAFCDTLFSDTQSHSKTKGSLPPLSLFSFLFSSLFFPFLPFSSLFSLSSLSPLSPLSPLSLLSLSLSSLSFVLRFCFVFETDRFCFLLLFLFLKKKI